MKIDTRGIWDDLFGTKLPSAPYADTLQDLSRLARQRFKPSEQALGNARGRWYEQLVLGNLWNMRQASRTAWWIPVRVGSVTEYSLTDLFDVRTRALLQELKTSLNSAGVRLITSNPDILFVRSDRLREVAPELCRRVTATELARDFPFRVRNALAGQLRWTDLLGGASVKVTLRPDRRLQAPHEGSVLKALMVHLRTRYWQRPRQRFRYFCLCTAFNAADEEALRTAATHSIVSVESTAERAVDGLFRVNSSADLRSFVRSANRLLR